jgi:predicted dehydrogenase
VVRRDAEVERLSTQQQLTAVTELDRVDEFEPDFVVVATPPEANLDTCERLISDGHAVLLETPPGVTPDELDRILQMHDAGARIQVAEQYRFQPLHAARLAIVESGRLGTISSAHISVAHAYHGVALLRAALGIGIGIVEVTAQDHHSTIITGPGRGGQPTTDVLVPSKQTVAMLGFGTQLGIYDWCDDQYFSWVRSLRFTVRGSHGELDGHEVRYVRSDGVPVHQTLRRWDTGLEGNLETPGHRGYLLGDEWVYQNPFPTSRLTDDEIAIATVLEKMARHLADGSPLYSVDSAVHDTRIARAIINAVEEGGRTTVAAR